MKRVIVIVLDGVGIGALPDAAEYGDAGSHTLAHTAKAVGGMTLPNLERLGLGKIDAIDGLDPAVPAAASYGKMAEQSAGKDTTTGHWELTGVVNEEAFPTYPMGFPAHILREFAQRVGRRGVLGNKPASGTEIIRELGPAHLELGLPIVYTSADSVFQVAACEDVVPVPELYHMCETARELLTGKHRVCRVIARPFVVQDGEYVRTDRRKDFSVQAPESTLLDIAVREGLTTVGIGKIGDIFAHRGLSREIHTSCNAEGIEETLRAMQSQRGGIIMTNLVDFDMKFGHRNDPDGFYEALREFDDALPSLLAAVGEDDLLILTADHGCDPTTESTDHSREYVPLLVYAPAAREPVELGVRNTFADAAATAADFLRVPKPPNGSRFLWDAR